MKLRIMLMLSASIIALLLAGCEKPMVGSDVQGGWVAEKASQQKWIKGTNRCHITLRADGTFIASVPDYMMTTSDKASGQVISGKGQWNLEPPKALAPVGIGLSFSEVDGKRKNWSVSNTLKAARGKQGSHLFFYVREEGGERFVFERALGQASINATEK
ncbi:MAG: hypothetical protein L0Z50_38920 [Verrucomicrobiales bacterium]|nr:hypothetical protein [Verrucomicrobiales bacterium]